MPSAVRPFLTAAFLALLASLAARGQEQSVRPGINDSFQKPDVGQFVERFEGESREVFARRHEIVAACQLRPGQTVADIGAGTGLFTRLFAAAVGREGRVLAVDIAAEFLGHIRRSSREQGLANVDTVLCRPDSTELPPASVDVAFICDTYHHFEFPHKTLASLHRALKPGGRLVLIDFHCVEGRSSDWVLGHVRAGQEVFEAEITQAGFRKIHEHSDLLRENYFVVFQQVGATPLAFPIIADRGGVAPRPDAVDQPRAGAKVVFDATADAAPGDIHKSLDRAARLLNLYGAAGLRAADVRLTIVLHGAATQAALSDTAYRARFDRPANPNLPLIRELKQAGVEVLVCGQALNYGGYADGEVASEVPIAASALTVVMNRQSQGYAYLPIP